MLQKKTAGVLGDDLALNAQQVSGVNADRELPVVWAVAKGSLLNKVILVPAALAISAFIPWLITPLLIIGGLFLCYEGVEKIIHTFFHSPTEKAKHHDELIHAINSPEIDLLTFEKDKIKGAIRTDFILSAEIIAITLGVVASEPLITQAGVLSVVALLVTVIVYGLVGGIVRLDDWGLYWYQKTGDSLVIRTQQKIGYGILQAAPVLMKTLSIVGTAAMFLVGGGILTHGIPFLHHFVATIVHTLQTLPTIGSVLAVITPIALDGIIGVIAGFAIVIVISNIKKLMTTFR